MTILIPVILIAAALALVVSPFRKRAPESGDSRPGADETLEREEMLLAERLDLEYDYQMGKLTYEEYRRLTDLWEADIRQLGEDHGNTGFLRRLEQELQERIQALDAREGRSPSRTSGGQEGNDVDRPMDSTTARPRHARTP
ncbi:hypothetical protein [Kyrpidia sp.]|uniref:hypothetical protein n=1 Tax=Kyrpidia sp. TaxID=2073077 RepID=UPI00258F18FE|nr:hypothetical protein [Kyrpidia sp.]MCL6575773.1 hypothetical protein [Kyrpidia sp.]